jgi:hypothetical protein
LIQRQEQLLAAFEAAVADGDTGALAALLSDDIKLCADGGGRVPTVLQLLRGRAEVLDFIAQARQWWRAYRWIASSLNGGCGVILQSGNRQPPRSPLPTPKPAG